MGNPFTAKRHPNPSVRIEQALQKMRSRGVLDDHCPRCKRVDWKVDIVNIPASSEVGFKSIPPLAGHAYVYTPTPTGLLSLISIVCGNCGFTMFHNTDILDV